MIKVQAFTSVMMAFVAPSGLYGLIGTPSPLTQLRGAGFPLQECLLVPLLAR